MTSFADDSTLGEVRLYVSEHMENGTTCPVCTQNVKIYKRPMTATTARAMISMHREVGRDYTHLPTLIRNRLPDVAHQGGYATIAQHWGLIEEEKVLRPDGGRAGWWRLTETGEGFVMGSLRVPKYALIFNSECGGVTGSLVSIAEVLGDKFHYDDLMAGAS